MPDPMSRKHLTDKTLISCLDGELKLKERLRVKRHLFGCWQCRTRLNQFEKQVRQLATAYHSEVYPSPGRVDEARRKLFDEFHLISSQQPVRSTSETEGSLLNRRLSLGVFRIVAAVVGTLAIVLSLSLWLARHEPAPLSQPYLESAVLFDQKLQSSPDVVRQSYLVEFIQRKPTLERRSRRLEIWVHAPAGRFTSRWNSLDGTLQHAVWRPAEDEAFAYRATAGPGAIEKLHRTARPVPLLQLVENGSDTQELERAFLDWMEQRDWRPVSLTADLAIYASQEGAVFRAERVTDREGGERIRLLVRRMRYESPDKSLELVFVASAAEYIPAELVEASLFQPSDSLRQELARLRIAPESRKDPPTPISLQPDAEAIANAEMELLFALHSLGVCRGEQISVVRGDGSLEIFGVVTSSERKEQILAALEPSLREDWVTSEIKTVEEAVMSRVPGAETYSTALTERAENKLPIQEELENYFLLQPGQNPEDHAVTARVRAMQFAAEINAKWDLVRSEAFALHGLAQRYSSPASEELLSHRNRWLLEVMVKDHVRELDGKWNAVSTELEPVLRAITKNTAGVPRLDDALQDAEEQMGRQDWALNTSAVLEAVKRSHRLVRQLFTSGESARGEISNAEAMESLLNAFATLAVQSERLDKAVAGGFEKMTPAASR